jgi:hypothetical protein
MGVCSQIRAGWYELTRKDGDEKTRIKLNKTEARVLFNRYSELGFRKIWLDDDQAERCLVSAEVTK